MTNRIFKIGQSREQGSFQPARIEDYVAPNNPVRAIVAYVCAFDLAALGFRHAEGDGGAGQPPYDPRSAEAVSARLFQSGTVLTAS